MSPIEKLKAKLAAQKEKSANTGSTKKSGGDNAVYAHWNIPDNTTATLRFLPDADLENEFFWVERQSIKLPFQGVVGGDYPTTKEVEVTVPCVQMFGMTCPVVSAIRPWWKEEDKIDLARKYYRKKSYIFQGFVVNSPMAEDNVPENPIRRFVISPSIFAKIEKGLMDPDMVDLPTDYIGGCDFNIEKVKRGQYPNYDNSNYARRSRSLTAVEQAAIAEHTLFDLKTYLGAKPEADGVAAIGAMFEASLAGEPFDMESFGQYYRPYGGGRDSGSSSTGGSASNADAYVAPVSTPSVVAEEAAPAATGRPDPAAIMARIKARASK